VLEWGPAPKPAHFILAAGADNTFYAQLSNITRLRLRMGESPFDRAQPLRVSVGGAVPFEVPAPLPETLVLAGGPQAWQAETKPELPAFRLHTPGGLMLLYDGSPLLIVHGTRGDAKVCEAMRAVAEMASKSPNPGGAPDGGPRGSDGVPYHQNLYGRLNVKAERTVDLPVVLTGRLCSLCAGAERRPDAHFAAVAELAGQSHNSALALGAGIQRTNPTSPTA
jgi:hypothetical protein